MKKTAKAAAAPAPKKRLSLKKDTLKTLSASPGHARAVKGGAAVRQSIGGSHTISGSFGLSG